NIHYRYRVGANDYEGRRVRFGSPGRTTRRQAEELIGKYPAGAHVSVHYNSQRPSESVLEPQDTSNVAALTALLLLFCAIAAVLVAHGIAGKVLTTDAGVPLFAFLPPLGAIGFGAVAIAAYFKLRGERLASANWPTAMGKITQSQVMTEIERSRDDNDRET